MGGCFSKCSSKNIRVTEVLKLSSPVAGISDSLPIKSPVLNAEKESRRFRKTSANSGEKGGGDERNADDKRRRWCFRNRSRVMVSPMHDDGGPINKTVRRFPVEKSPFVTVARTTDNCTQKIAGATTSLNVFKIKPARGSSQPLNSMVKPKRTVNANIRTLKLLRVENVATGELVIEEIVSEEEIGIPIPEDSYLAASVSSKVVKEHVEALPRPKTAHQKRLVDKHSREVTVFENIVEEIDDKVIKEPKVDYTTVNVPTASGPKVTVINVRPKTPETAKIEVVPQLKAAKHSALIVKKDKEQMVPKFSEMPSLIKDENDGDPVEDSPELSEETASESSFNSDDVTSSVPGHERQAPGPAQENPECGKPKKTKKKRPVKIYPYTKGRMIPQLPYPEDPLWFAPPKPAGKTSQRRPEDYDDFASRLMNPCEKARATEGKILDGTLITWPKYIKCRGQDNGQSKTGAQMATIGGAHKSKMAWSGEPSQESAPTPVLHSSPRFSSSASGPAMNDASKNDQRVGPGTKNERYIARNDVPTEEATRRFTYRPPTSSECRQVVPFFKEKKLSFSPPTPPDSSGEEEDFVFTPENLRRYAKKRRAKLQRRPKTPFRGKPATVSNDAQAEHQGEALAKPLSTPRVEPQDPSTANPLCTSTCNETASKCVTFVIPLEGGTVRPPSSRPNTRRQMRPMTPRANAGELALRQASAQKRRDDVMKSRVHGLGKRKHRAKDKSRVEVEKAKAQKLMDKVEKKMKKHGENRKKRIENIVAKHAEHHERVQHRHDVIYTRKRFLGQELGASAVSSAKFTVGDLVDIDRFFDEMDKCYISLRSSN